MKALNIGNHHLGYRGYDDKEPICAKEDQAYREHGNENLYNNYTHPETKRFVRSRYNKENESG